MERIRLRSETKSAPKTTGQKYNELTNISVSNYHQRLMIAEKAIELPPQPAITGYIR
jgi:hypothetical protein